MNLRSVYSSCTRTTRALQRNLVRHFSILPSDGLGKFLLMVEEQPGHAWKHSHSCLEDMPLSGSMDFRRLLKTCALAWLQPFPPLMLLSKYPMLAYTVETIHSGCQRDHLMPEPAICNAQLPAKAFTQKNSEQVCKER